jgi:hypothetical protein
MTRLGQVLWIGLPEYRNVKKNLGMLYVEHMTSEQVIHVNQFHLKDVNDVISIPSIDMVNHLLSIPGSLHSHMVWVLTSSSDVIDVKMSIVYIVRKAWLNV